jgi:hypothetical protein
MTALEAQGATMNLDIGAVADFEFYQSFGADSSAAILARANNLDGIFSGQLGIQISVAQIDVFSENSDPFTSTDPQTLLDEVAVYRGATAAQDAQGLTHLFTGRDLDGTTAGIAFLGVVCSTRSQFDTQGRSFGAGLSEGRRGAVVDSLIAAHEIGHNFGAPHDAESGSTCESTPATFLMAPSISAFDQFSACSIEEMQPEIAAASCMTAIGGSDLALTALVPNPTVQANTAYDYVFQVANTGAEDATGATLDASFDGSLEILSATASAGSCSLGTATVSCALGDVPGGSMRSVQVTLRSALPGQYPVTAASSATSSDANPDNDQITGSVTVVPVVDLILSEETATLTTDQSATVQVALRNDSNFTASALVLLANFSTDLRLDNASLGGETCVVSGQDMTCNLASLNAGSQTQLVLQLTGLSNGSKQGTLNVTADEEEFNAADNTALLSIQINDATTAPPQAASGEEGGGGSVSWLWSLLALPALRQRLSARKTRQPRLRLPG